MTKTPNSMLRAWADLHHVGGDERRYELVLAFARAMHDITSGDWEAAGYITRCSFVMAADTAVHRLEQDGHDLLSVVFPVEPV